MSYRADILAAGGVTLYAWQNVARGSYGYEVLRLERDGLLSGQFVRGVLPDESSWKYILTEAGQKAALAEIGVTEG